MMDVRAMAIPQVIAVVTAFLASIVLVTLLKPLLQRHLMATPNSRSSHRVATPQGGGIAVVLALACGLGLCALLAPGQRVALAGVLPLSAAVLLLTVIGAIDDFIGIPVVARLMLQAAALIDVLATMPDEVRAVPLVPLVAERGVEFIAGLWFVNLVNFMDGIDLMTVTETVTIAAAIFLFSLFGEAPPVAGVMALALLGAMLGFAPFNLPVARLFLGDAGSLPIGLVLFWLLLQLAGAGHLAAALLLPLYYLADATITLLWRLARGENPMKAHRVHFYQVATARGMPVSGVVAAVFAVNVALMVFAAVAVSAASPWIDLAALTLGGASVTGLLFVLGRGR